MKPILGANLLAVVAVADEIPLEEWSNRGNIVFTGIGKINTCFKLIEAINNYKPEIIVNLGSAGSLDKNISGVVEVAEVIERDFNAFPLCDRGRIPFENNSNRYKSGYTGVICGSGDSFVHEFDPWLEQNQVSVVDMELIAIARICHKFGIPWRSLKYISDYVGINKNNEWHEGVKKASDYLIDAFDNLFIWK